MITLTCKTCGKQFQVKPYRANSAQYCSVGCMAKGYVGMQPKYIPPKKQVDLICPHCGKEFQRIASRLKYGRGKYCSPECQYAARKLEQTPNRKIFTCLNCGKTYFRYNSWIGGKTGSGKYCSRACRDAHRIGANHPQFIDGADNRRGPNWQAQKRKALARDKRICQHCGNIGEHVHHKIPFRIFGIERYKEANQLSNLETLCEPCHRRADAEIQRQR